MAETEAIIGYGSIFEISTDDGATFDPIAEVYDITPPSDSIDVIDATHMQSPNATREFILGLNDPGECSFEMNFIPGSDADTAIQAIRAAREKVTCRITWPNDVTWTFSGILTAYEPAAPTDDKMTATVTFKVTGSYVTGSRRLMANAVKGEVAFSSGGEDYILVFDFNALCELEEEFGVQASKLGEVIGTKAKNIRTVFRIGLGRHQDLSDEAAGDIITEIGPQKAGELITEGFTRAYPEAAKGTGNPRKARRAGTG